ncbi:MAG: hypothetical protein GC153_10105 [Alphaproteobacteria bacterium]|nr:hypothetical protein [Alphaproteobacteria bacterium]
MQTRLYLAAAGAALALGGVGLGVRDHSGAKGVSFINPIEFARSLCGGDPAAMARRQAYFLTIARAYAEEAPAATPAATDVPEAVGDIRREISTKSADAQGWFNRGLADMLNFNHGAAIEDFRMAQAADPECAMCYWGEAIAYGPNINAPMEDDAVAPAFAAIKKALSLRDGAGERERALIAALGYRYQAKPLSDRSKLDNAYADAMEKLTHAYPDDDFVLTLAAEANMDTQPWDYWTADGRLPKGRAARTMELLETVLARSPKDPAAIHLYIHMTEASDNPYRAARFAETLPALAPGLGHLIHMPSHTYYRIGRFKQSIAQNAAAVAADEAFLAGHKASPIYEFGYYPHNVHFLMTSAQMAGDAKTALAMAAKLDAKLPAEMARLVPFAQPIKAAPYFAMAQFAEPQAILDLPDPGRDLPFLEAAWRYARGEAFARSGAPEKARAEARAVARIIKEADLSTLEAVSIPARDILRIEERIVTARAAAAEGDLSSAVAAMEEAVALQEGLAYTEPPYWYYPAKQTLAAMVLRQGDAERAEQLFIEALAEAPNNGWAYYGLSQAYRAQKDRQGAKYAEKLFKAAWAGDPKSVDLASL